MAMPVYQQVKETLVFDAVLSLRHHPDLPRGWVFNTIEYPSTEELALRGINN